jgi:hypothetical protein
MVVEPTVVKTMVEATMETHATVESARSAVEPAFSHSCIRSSSISSRSDARPIANSPVNG